MQTFFSFLQLLVDGLRHFHRLLVCRKLAFYGVIVRFILRHFNPYRVYRFTENVFLYQLDTGTDSYLEFIVFRVLVSLQSETLRQWRNFITKSRNWLFVDGCLQILNREQLFDFSFHSLRNPILSCLQYTFDFVDALILTEPLVGSV